MSFSVLLSVIICAHNPKPDYLSRVLQALNIQSLSKDVWELILIDNASEKFLSQEIDLSWHQHSRHIREERLGLTHARLRGIREASAETLIFADDDNILDVDYLKFALEISQEHSFLGVWGGQLIPEFEVEPPEWTKPYWGYLALLEFDRDRWSNLHYGGTAPSGAGMCVRKVVADKYADLVGNDSKRINLGRKGTSLVSCEDTDLAYTACDVGLGMGQFVRLKLTHLMPANRLTEDYLIRMLEANTFSSIICKSLREEIQPPPKPSWRRKILQSYFLWRANPRDSRFYLAKQRGEDLAFKQLSSN